MQISLLRSFFAASIFVLWITLSSEYSCPTLHTHKSIAIELSSQNNLINACNIKTVIINRTDTIVRFYEDWNLWGYFNIIFEITTPDSVYIIYKKVRGWTKNFPSYKTLYPGDSMVLDYFRDRNCYWEDLPAFTGKNYECAKIKATYKLDEETHKSVRLNWFNQDSIKAIKTFQSFPLSKIISKEYDITIKNGIVQSLQMIK